MKSIIWRVVTVLVCCALVMGVVACTGNGAGGNNSAAGNTAGGGSAGNSANNAGGGASESNNAGGSQTTGGGGGSENAGSGAQARDVLNIAYAQDSGTLDPIYNVGFDILNGIRMLYEPLWEQFGQDKNLEYRYVLAESAEMTDDYTLLVRMKDNAYFASGNKVTAEDVLFTLDKANNREGLTAMFRTMDMEKTKVVDERTIEIVFTERAIDLRAGFATFYVYDRLSYDAATIATVPVGSGPYKLDSYVVGSQLNLVTRDDYWGGKSDIIPKLNFKKLSEEAQRVNALMTGDVDIATVPFQDIDYVNEEIDDMEVFFFSGDTTCVVHMNPTIKRNCFSELGVDARRAIALAIDRESIVKVVYSGYAKVSRFPLSTGTADAYPELFDLGIYGEGYNPTLAKELAQSSGLVNYKPLLINNGSPVNSLITEIIQLNLASIGVEIEVQTLDSGSWLTVAFDESQWDMAVDFTFGGTVAAGYRTWVRMIGGYLTSPWPGSERFIELVEGPPAITEISDYNVLNAYYKELTDIHVAAIPWFILCDVLVPTAHHKDLKGWQPMRSGNIIYTDLRW